jgi:hypothetical protein
MLRRLKKVLSKKKSRKLLRRLDFDLLTKSWKFVKKKV